MDKPTRVLKASEVKITKKGVDAALAAGNSHAKFQNKGVQKRLMKNQAKIKRQQELRENMHRRQQKVLTGVMKNVAQSGGVLSEGATALAKLLDVKTDAVTPSIDPASIGGDLVDVDHNPENFNVQFTDNSQVQYISPDEVDVTEDGQRVLHGDGTTSAFPVLEDKDGLIYVQLFSKDELTVNRIMLNLYGDAQNYKPLPEIGDLVRPNGIAIAMRTFPAGTTVPEIDPATLTEVNYIFDVIRFAPPGEVVSITDTEIGIRPSDETMKAMAEGKVHITSADIMNARIGCDEITRMYPNVIEPMTPEHLSAFEVPHDSGRTQMFGSSLEAAMHARSESFTDVSGKIQNSTISPPRLNLMQNIVHSTAHRQDHVYDPLLHVTQAEVGSCAMTPKAEPTGSSVTPISTLSEDDPDYSQKRRDLVELHARNRVAAGNTDGIYVKPAEDNKDDAAGDTTFSLKP